MRRWKKLSSIFNYLPAPYVQGNPEKRYEYAVWKYFSCPGEKEKAHLGIVIFDGNYLEAKLGDKFSTRSIDLMAEFRRVRDEIYILVLYLNSKREKKLKEVIDAFSREERFRFGHARVDYSLGNQTEALEHLFRQYVGYGEYIRPNIY